MKLGTKTRRSKTIEVLGIDGKIIATYEGYSNASRATGVKIQNIYKTCKGYKTTLNGFNFRFKDELY